DEAQQVAVEMAGLFELDDVEAEMPEAADLERPLQQDAADIVALAISGHGVPPPDSGWRDHTTNHRHVGSVARGRRFVVAKAGGGGGRGRRGTRTPAPTTAAARRSPKWAIAVLAVPSTPGCRRAPRHARFRRRRAPRRARTRPRWRRT